MKLPKQARPRDVYLRAAQLTCSPARAGWLRSLVLLLLGVGGLRWGEVISLRVYDVSTRTRTALWWLSGHDRVSRDRHRQMPRAPAVDPHSTAATSVPGWPFTHCGIQRPRGLSRRARAPKVVQRMLGHASAAITLDVYADLFECDLDAVAESVSRMCPRWA